MTEMWVKFDRVGRNRNVPQLAINLDAAQKDVVDGETGTATTEIAWDNVSDQVYDAIRKYIASSDPEVAIYERPDGTRCGRITVGGFRDAGSFEIEELP